MIRAEVQTARPAHVPTLPVVVYRFVSAQVAIVLALGRLLRRRPLTRVDTWD